VDIAKNQEHLDTTQQQALLGILKRHEDAFQGRAGQWNGEPIEIKLKDGVQPCWKRAYKIPQAYRELVEQEIGRLEKAGVLEKSSSPSEWGAPSFVIPKKDGGIRLLTDFRDLNKSVKRTPCEYERVEDTIDSIGRFNFATTIDQPMGYYGMMVARGSRKYLTINLPWGQYEYTCLPQGMIISSDVFQYRMNELYGDMREKVKVYIDDILVIGKGTFEEHLTDVSEVIERLKLKGMQIRADKCEWAQKTVNYLGFKLSRDGVEPLPSKVRALLAVKPPRASDRVNQERDEIRLD